MKTYALALILLSSALFGQSTPAQGLIFNQLSSDPPATTSLVGSTDNQDQGPSIRITVTGPDGNSFSARVYGVPAAAAMEILSQWMATQTRSDGSPKYINVADVIRQHSIELVRSLVSQGYVSSETRAEMEKIRAAQSMIEEKRNQLIEAALKQQ